MKAFFLKIWRFSWVVTLPIAICFVYWGWCSGVRYFDFKVRYSAAEDFSLLKVGKMEFLHALRKSKIETFRNNKQINSENLRTINLFIPESELAQLNSNLPHSGSEYVKGGAYYGGKLHKVKLKYRGDTVYHWGYYKKSIRVKTKKSSLFEGMRAFNLVAPRSAEMINNHLTYILADKMGLIAPRSEVVNVNINGELSGIYILTEQLDESTLRRHNRMPGDLYSGDVGRKDFWRGETCQIFERTVLWEKRAVNNHYPEDSSKPLEQLIKLLRLPQTEEVQVELTKLVDMEAFGKFNALEMLTTTVHIDSTHNWRLYYDPMRSKFVPVVWDFVGWHITTRPKNGKKARLDVISSPFHLALYKNGNFLRARQNALKEFYANGTDRSFLKEVDVLYGSLKSAVKNDPNLAANVRALNSKEVILALDDLKSSIPRVFRDIYNGYFNSQSEVRYSSDGVNRVIGLEIKGRAITNRLVFKFNNLLSSAVKCHLRYWVNGQVKEVDVSENLALRGSTLDLRVPFLSRYILQIESVQSYKSFHNRVDIQPAYYELIFDSIPPDIKLLEVLFGEGDGRRLVRASQVANLRPHSFDDMYNIVQPHPSKAPMIWSQDVVLEGFRKIDEEVIILPGTTIRLEPSATVVFRNLLRAEGSADKPIRFVSPGDAQNPWGAVVLMGKGANGSRLRYVEFANGSGLKGDLFEYTAMFSVHDVKGVEIENCTFRDSKITDDMVHAVYSEVRFSDCRFERSLMDALDIDISDTVIERCHFIDSGNDSIDLMTSTAIVVDTLIENSGDKAASVGESSSLLAVNNVFRGNLIGVQAKDGSVASLYNLDLINNGHALDAYKKNWRYNDGGKVYLHKSRVVGNKKLITADKKSAIRVYDSYIDKPVKTTKKRLKLAKTVDSKNEKKARSQGLKRSKKEIELMKGFDSRYWDRVDRGRRGASNVVNY